MSLVPVLIAQDGDQGYAGSSRASWQTLFLPSESLIRLLLGVQPIQSDLIEYLLQKLPELSDDEYSADEISPTALVVRQLRWLDYITDPERLTTQLMEILSILSSNAQRDVIASLPDIVTDAEHEFIAKELVGLFQHNSDLTVPILDALSNLQCPADLTSQMRAVILERLRSADVEDLPVMIRFLFQTATADNVTALVSRLRKNLDLASLHPSGGSRASGAPGTPAKHPEALILDAVYFGLQFHKFIRDGWLRLLGDLALPADHFALDVVVLCLLHGITSTRSRAQQTLRRKLTSQQFTAGQLGAAVTAHGRSLQAHFPTLLAIAEHLMRGGGARPALAEAALGLYRACFSVFDAYYRQEVVGALVTHVGSGDRAETDTALAALLAITEHDPVGMRPYAVFVRGILDYIDNLRLDQVRLLFGILGALLRSSAPHGIDTGFYDEVHIFLRKQLSSHVEKYKILGIIGGVALVRQLGATPEAVDDVAGGGGSSRTGAAGPQVAALRNALSLINLIIDSGRLQSWTCLAIAYDELSNAVTRGTLDPRLEAWLTENVANSFADLFICETDALPGLQAEASDPGKGKAPATGVDDDDNLGVEVWFDLDALESSVVLRLFQFLSGGPLGPDNQSDIIGHLQSLGKDVDGNPLACLCSLFRLFQACEKAGNAGSLADIDVPLGCGVLLFRRTPLVSGDFEQWTEPDKARAMTGLLAAINWYRELLNAYADQTDPGIRERVIRRLGHAVHLQSWLTVLNRSAQTAFNPVGTLLPPADWQHDPGTPGIGIKGDSTCLSQGYLRELTLDAFRILQFSTLAPWGTVATAKGNTPTLAPSDLVYLLDDLTQKMEGTLCKAQFLSVPSTWCIGRDYDGIRGAPNGGTALQVSGGSEDQGHQIFCRLLPLVPSLAVALQVAFAAVANAAAETVDSVSPNSEDSALVAEVDADPASAYRRCLELLLTLCGQYLRWSGLREPRHRALLIETLGCWGGIVADPGRGTVDDDEPTLLAHSWAVFDRLTRATASCHIPAVGLRVLKLLHQIYELNWCHLHPQDVALVTIKECRKPYQMRQGGFTFYPEFHRLGLKVSEVAAGLLGSLGASGPRIDAANGDGEDDDEEATPETEGRHALVTPRGFKSADLVYLLQTEITFAADPVARITTYANAGFAAMLADDPRPPPEFPLLTPKTFPVFYRSVTVALTEVVAGFEVPEVTLLTTGLAQPRPGDPRAEDGDFGPAGVTRRLSEIQAAVDVWRALIGLVQVRDSHEFLIPALRCGRYFAAAFIATCVVFMERHFRVTRTRLSAIFKPLQRTTRTLQTMCGHAKATRDPQLAALVPPLRKELEKLVYRIKAMFERNNCLAAFSVGSLKHRNLAGEEVPSQMPPPPDAGEFSGDSDDDGDEHDGLPSGMNDPTLEVDDVGELMQSLVDRLSDSEADGVDHRDRDPVSSDQVTERSGVRKKAAKRPPAEKPGPKKRPRARATDQPETVDRPPTHDKPLNKKQHRAARFGNLMARKERRERGRRAAEEEATDNQLSNSQVGVSGDSDHADTMEEE
ncbi:hypothetical protein IWQ60_000752 [Tieghemiomyces parasiticus]|uniref:Fanconi anemia group D2 protein n=1 Tax=Tieghemiomyces parasiticus TaxID=78921 RepID=A0A9W8E2H5_9FUNG|nr:hypothetical protein IWQ60_000752 [Tieghemiomyces parasiticus]